MQRSQVQTYANVERLRKIMDEDLKMTRTGRVPGFAGNGELARNLSLVGQMINADFGTRVFYLSINGFDTHSDQQRQHEQLLQQIATAVSGFFDQLKQGGNAERVLLMTFSEFGRRVQENGSKGTDHGAGSCLFVVGPGVKGGAVGKHPSLRRPGRRRPAAPHRLPPRLRAPCSTAGSGATAGPYSAAVSTRPRC